MAASARSRRELLLPHPGIVERNFVLYPLADIAPDLELPGLGRVAELAAPTHVRGPQRALEPMANEPAHKYIVVEGPIGVGKTSLARRLCASLGAQGVLEQAARESVPRALLPNPRAGALPTQLYFLFQRAQQLAALKQADLFAPVRVADYLLEKDRLFARVTLDDAEYALYEQLYAKLDIQAPKPDLVVYLQAPVDVLLERIAKRGVDYEQYIDRAVPGAPQRGLRALLPRVRGRAAADRQCRLRSTRSANQRDYDELLAAIKRMTRGRLYYNPLRSRAI